MNWIKGLSLALAAAGCLVLGRIWADTYNYYYNNGADQTIPRPVATARCVLQGPFKCEAHEQVYSMKGVSCVEDCLYFNKLNNCDLSNECHWDAGSGCFVKDVCVEVSALHRCKRWERTPVCD